MANGHWSLLVAAIAVSTGLLVSLVRQGAGGNGWWDASPKAAAALGAAAREGGAPPRPPLPRAAAGDGDYPRYPAVPRKEGACRVWSADELALHGGEDRRRPLLLAILGEVYDVGTGAKHYAPGSGYHAFAARDHGRGFADRELAEGEDVMSKVEDLTPEGLQGVLGWRDFYRDHKSYRFVGFLEGRYYDADGRATAELRRVEALHKEAAKVEEVRKQLQARFLACNSQHTAGDAFFQIWCDDGYHKPGSTPLHVYHRPPGQKDGQGWCACVPPREREAAEQEASSPMAAFRLVDYPECPKGAQRCQRPKGANAP